jgi:hypothetical protein
MTGERVEQQGGATDLPVPFEHWDEAAAHEVIREAAARYIAGCRERVGPFVDQHFSLKGTLKLHRRALGWDLIKAPVNVAVSVPQIGIRLLSATGRRLPLIKGPADRLGRINLFLSTNVGRELAWLVMTELLQLPAEDAKRGRKSERDAFAEAILADPRIQRSVMRAADAVARRGGDPAFRKGLEAKLRIYADTRAAASDMVGMLTIVGAGAVAAHQFTPGAITLVPALSALLAQQLAIASFPLGAWAGGLWYSAFPATASVGLVAATGGVVLGIASVLTAFAGVIADPVQRKLGLHKRRLEKLLDKLERELAGGNPQRLALHDHYVARVLDLVDMMIAAYRFAAR